MTVRDLKKALADLPNAAEVVIYDTMEDVEFGCPLGVCEMYRDRADGGLWKDLAGEKADGRDMDETSVLAIRLLPT